MEKCRILAIMPYKSLNNVVYEVANSYDSLIELEIYDGDLSAGAKIAYRMRNAGFDVILSRGGTAEKIKDRVNIPVIDIGYSGYDLIRAIVMGQNLLHSPTFLISKKMEEGMKSICQSMGIDLPIISIESDLLPEFYTDHLMRLQEQGTDLVCYSNVINESAKLLGIHSILMTSGIESVRTAVHTALQIFEVLQQERERQAILKQILSFGKEIICLFEGNQIIYTNLNNPNDVNEVLGQLDAYTMFGEDFFTSGTELSIGGTKRILTAAKIDTAGKYLLFRLKNPSIQVIHDTITQIESRPSSESSLLSMISKDQALKLRTIAKHCYQNSLPLHLVGPAGTCKHRIAFELFNLFSDPSSIFYSVNCKKIDTASIREFYEKLVPEIGISHTIYLDGVEFLDEDCQGEILSLLCNRESLHLQFISSAEVNLWQSVKRGSFSKKLHTLLTQYLEIIPPLKGQESTIESLVLSNIAQINAQTRGQIIGINQNALEYLKKYDWPMNIFQLERVIKTVAATTTHGKITLFDVTQVLEDEKRYQDITTNSPINLHGTLDEIRARIVSAVLAEEEMNQSRAAKRLGISRSTMWKILKTYNN